MERDNMEGYGMDQTSLACMFCLLNRGPWGTDPMSFHTKCVDVRVNKPTVVVDDWCITNFAHGWWVSIRNMCKTLWTDIEHKSLYYLLIMQDKVNLQLSKIAS